MKLRTRVRLPIKIGLLLCLMFVSMGDSCSPDCNSCNHTHNAQVIITFQDNTSTTKVTNDNGCVSYFSKNSDCGTVSDLNGSSVSFSFNPSSIDLQSPPSTFTASGSSLSTTYGMPVVEFIDDTGSMVGSATASSISSNGTTLTATTPSLSSAYSGLWTLAVFNKTSSGSLSYIGSGSVEATGRDYPSCNPSDEQVSNCEMQLGFFWDYDTCSCVDRNP